MNGQTNREKELFADALALDPAERMPFLKRACGTDADLLQQVQDLLEAHTDVSPVLRTTSTAVLGGETLSEGPGTKIGRYKLLQKIGEGGMGVVYMAEQTEPVHRRVALKIIKLGMDTRQVVARFEAERQALALMDHPNIARVLDGGATETGRPYFVMELVQGVPITEFCDRNKVPARERLKLFISICRAIQSAHQKGIIHRDIKPSNVLVTLHHGEPMPKVIDFGIAKATNQKLTEKTLFTHYAAMIGTPAYMSPEQAEMSSMDVDTRTDVYALGVLLYELLTGTTPFPEKRLRSLGYGEMQLVIAEEDPERPSTRLSTMANEQKTALARSHGQQLDALDRLLRGDLDWIVMKCLEKDRTRRYETANGLAADLARHLNNEPVVARPPTTVYRLQKTWRRNKLAFAAAAAVAGALAIGMGTSLWQATRATAARNHAERNEQIAMANAATAQAEHDKAEAASYEARLHRYVSDVGIAYRLLLEGSLTRAQELLSQHMPSDPAQPDFRGFEWHYLWQLCRGDALVASLPQQFPVESVAVSSDGHWVAATSSRGAAGFSPWLRTSDSQPPGELTIFSAQSLQSVAIRATKLSPPTAVAFSPSEATLLVGHSDGTVSRWSGNLFGQGETLAGRHNDSVRSITFSPAGDFFATGGLDGRVLLWRSADRTVVGDELVGWPVWDVALSPDSHQLAVAGQSEKVLILDPITRSRKEVGLSAGWVTCLALSPTDPELLIMGRMNSRLIGHNLVSGDSFVLGKHEASVTDVAFLRDGTTLVSSGLDQSIRIWDTESRQPLGLLKGHTDSLWQLAPSRTDSRIYSASADRTVKAWETRYPQEFDLLHRGTNWVFGLEFSGDGRWLAGSFRDHTLHLWDVATQTETSHHRLSVAQLVRGLAFDWRRHRVIVGSYDGMVEVWDTRQRQIHQVFRAHAGHLYCHAISPDGRFLASATGGRTPGEAKGELRLWDADSYHPVADPLMINDTGISVLAFTPDGRTLAVGCPDGSVTLVDVPSGRQIAQAQGHSNPVFATAVSSDGKRLATGTLDDSLVWLWDLESLDKIAEFSCVSGTVYSLRFALDGRSLVAGYGNGKIRIWNLETGREVIAWDAHDAFVPGLALAPDGMTLASGSADGSIKLWPSTRSRPRDGETLKEFRFDNGKD